MRRASRTAREIGCERRGSGLDPVDFVLAGKLSGLGGLAKRIHGGRDQRHHGDGFFGDEFGETLSLEARHQDERRTKNQRRIEDHVQSIGVVKREATENGVGGVERGAAGTEKLIDVGDEIEVRQHDSLGQSGGAAGVGKRGESLFGRLLGLGENRSDAGEQVGERLSAGCVLARGVDAAEVGQASEVDPVKVFTVTD